MKTVDLSPLIENDQVFSRLTADVRERFICNWNDPVHDSYREYVQETEDRSAELHELRCKAEVLKEQMEKHNVEGLIAEVEELRIEAQSI